jgi:hypothetical protein
LSTNRDLLGKQKGSSHLAHAHTWATSPFFWHGMDGKPPNFITKGENNKKETKL